MQAMKAGDVFTATDGNDYRACRFDEFRCANCGRVTLTGLCGCPSADPVKIGEKLIGMPVAAEAALSV